MVAGVLSAPAARAHSCGGADKACAYAAVVAHSVRRIDSWGNAFSVPVVDRIRVEDAPVLDFVTLDNVVQGLSLRPRAARSDPAFAADLRRALATLPPQVLRLLEHKLLAIVVVEDPGSTGFSDEVHDASGQPVAGFVVLDAGVLRGQRANAWATWREGTPFKPMAGSGIRARIAQAGHDDRVGALQYILLHELAHVISVGERFHPRWTQPPPDATGFAAYPFASISWQVEDKRYRPRPGDDFPQRASVVYYFGAKLGMDEAARTYRALERTHFPTLYAVTNPGDDFAEAFANYVHVVLMRRPFAIELLQDDRVEHAYGACWNTPRCEAKQAILEALLR